MIATTSEKETAFYTGFIKGFVDAINSRAFDGDRVVDERQPETQEQRDNGYFYGFESGRENLAVPEIYRRSASVAYSLLTNSH